MYQFSKKMRVIVLFLAAIVLFSSCATFLNGKYQKIEIAREIGDDILIDNEKPIMANNGKYKFQRDLKPKQISIKSEGYKDENFVLMQSKKSPIHFFSWIPFGVLLYPPFYDLGPKSWDYAKDAITYSKTPLLDNIKEGSKKVKINKISVDLPSEKISHKFYRGYKMYLAGKYTEKTNAEEKNMKMENTEFSYMLNQMLKEKGYIDTTRNVLKNSYLDDLIINASIKQFTINNVPMSLGLSSTGMLIVDLKIQWDVLDLYNKVIHSEEVDASSGQFAVYNYQKAGEVIENALKDVMEISFIKFMGNEKVNTLLYDKSDIELESKFSEINIHQSNNKVNNLAQSIKSTVTIKSKDAFGSGFIISNDGYIITNYHVVSEPENLRVRLNNEKEYDADIIRVSKIYDLALIKIDASDLSSFKISDSKEIEVATEIYAVGTPTAEDLSQTISKGIISGIRKSGDSKLIQTDASVNSGNSGGPIIDKNGVVIGVVSSKLKGFGVEGVAFGIPAYEVLDRLKLNLK